MYRLERCFVCMDCGWRGTGEGDCGACNQGPLLDAGKPDIRTWLVEEDDRRRIDRDRKLLWPSVIVAVFFGVPLIVITRGDVFGSLFAMIFGALGLWRLLAKVLPAKPRYPYLRG